MEPQINDECKDQICSFTETLNHCDNFTANNTSIKTEISINE